MPIDPEAYTNPVFFCQGEVLVEEIVAGELYHLLEDLPSCGLKIGDSMPREWDLIPANKAAKDALEREQGHYQ